MLMLDYKDYGWWYWLISTCCLWLAVLGIADTFTYAVVIGVTQLIHFTIAERSLVRFPVQVRLGYLSFLFITFIPGLQWLRWVPALGTLARVLTGYCIMARMLMLLPINRPVPLSLAFVKEAFLTPPVPGNILHGLPALKPNYQAAHA